MVGKGRWVRTRTSTIKEYSTLLKWNTEHVLYSSGNFYNGHRYYEIVIVCGNGVYTKPF